MTSDMALDWCRSLAAAVSARQLYPAEHPRAVAAVEDVRARAVALMGPRDSVALFLAEDRLMCGGDAVLGGGATARKVFDGLGVLGYDRITLQRGVTTAELQVLASALAAVGGEGYQGRAVGLASSAHVHYAALATQVITHSEAVTRLAAGSASYARQLIEVWNRIDREGVADQDALEALVTPLCDLATRQGTRMLPLARLESHDAYTAAHISNVALLSTVLAEVMGLPAAAVRDVGIAALLHDIGKLRVPDEVLNSTGRLSAEQMALMRQHPVTGARMLASTRGLPAIAPIVAYEHHLQAGGGGYPHVPKAWAIHPASAMTHVADVYDALRTNRPYRRALEHPEIIEMMLRDRKTVFDADVLDAFFEHVVPRTELGDAVTLTSERS